MIFSQNRTELRKMYAHAWKKRCDNQPLTPLETQITDIIAWHPEYQKEITHEELDKDYVPDGGQTNPYLHMALHLGIREQVATNRPPGIKKIYSSLVNKICDVHIAEHQMIDCLAETLWEAQNQGIAPDEARYIERLRKLIDDK
ncbi:MAG: hypothetical protein CMQ54_04020 [Gammaproteobacteria bacterium]|nr:hypothetical protein [Gammaproteobacteria bacterium]|tara:strand:- start:3567 stop:3998 length:432 start_codon:yes stop_codon:yes gene_type:complete